MQIVTKWGNSLAIRIPAVFAETLGISEGTEIELKASAGRLVITPRKHKYDIDQLVAAITPDNRHAEIDWGAPVGREQW
ncbi:MAG: AbrB/MazE/SpoVT family DNA-binding domain-containing protein [Candidatus Binataceae bacterium]|jgi:antitoxin MazE